jgi:transposase-like protein
MAKGKRRSAEKERFWRQMVAEHAKSGISVRRYCADRGVTEASFFAWRRELSRRDAAAKKQAGTGPASASAPPMRKGPAPRRFAQLQIAPGELVVGASIEIVLPSGARLRVLRGVCPQTLDTVLAALERRSC